MKKIIMIFLILIIAVNLCGFSSNEEEAIDENLATLLEEVGFVNHGEIWTCAGFETNEETKNDFYSVGWYNVKDNFGAITGKTVRVTMLYFEKGEPVVKCNDAFDYVTFRYNYEKGEMEIVDIYGYNY